MEYNEKIQLIKKLINDKNYNEAEKLLLEMIEQSKYQKVEDENNTYYSFNNYIELLIFWNMYKPEKKNIAPDINYGQIYYYLGYINIDTKNYGKAQEYLKKGLEWNPVDVSIMFELAAIHRVMGEIERYKAEVEKTHIYIYDISYMAKYLRELGWYYIEKRIYNLANALYTQSVNFLDTELARNELGFIAKQENRQARFSTREEMQQIFKDYNIIAGFNRNTVNLIYEEYTRLKEMNPQPAVVKELSQRLYDITLDAKFMTYYELKDENLGVKVVVPETWKYLTKDSYEKANITPNTTFFFITPGNQTVSIVCDGKCSEEQFEDAFNVNIENMKKNGTEIEKIFSTDGVKLNRKVFVKIKQEEKIIRLIQIYKIVNGLLFCSSWQVTNEECDLEQLLVKVSNTFAMGIVNSLNDMNYSEPNGSNDTVADNKLNEQDKINESDFTIKRINEEYQKNKISMDLIKMLHIYSDIKIQDDKQDPFWTDTSKNILEAIVIVNLINENEVSSNKIEKQIVDSSGVKKLLKDNYEKMNIPELNEIISKIKIIDSEKPFESVMDIIKKAFKISNQIKNEPTYSKPSVKSKKEDNLKEYIIKTKGYPIFKFYLPEDLGEYVPAKNSNIFELKQGNIQKLRVMVYKCESENELENSAKEWIERTKIDANMEEVSYRKEKIDNIPVEVYELKYINNTKSANKIYKIGYVDGYKVTISGGKVNGKEEIINNAFKTMKYEKNVEENNEQINNKPIEVNCPACNTNFELRWNIPATEKIFYCKCPNCGMEIKRGNPNYKGN